MKKALSILLLTGIFITATAGAVFASDYNSKLETNLEYVDGLGYEVNLKEDSNDIVLYEYDSGWKDFLGGRWIHGVNSTQVWSKFDHNRKVHKTTVRGLGGEYSYSGWIDPGFRASASWEKALFGNKAWADVK